MGGAGKLNDEVRVASSDFFGRESKLNDGGFAEAARGFDQELFAVGVIEGIEHLGVQRSEGNLEAERKADLGYGARRRDALCGES